MNDRWEEEYDESLRARERMDNINEKEWNDWMKSMTPKMGVGGENGAHKDLEGRLRDVEQELQELRRLFCDHTDQTTANSTLAEAVRSLGGKDYEVTDCSFSWDGDAWCVRGQLKISKDT